MATKRKNLYLFLALACFAGIILVFIFDGYFGVYDSLYMDNGQYPRKVEPDQWDGDEEYRYLQSTDLQRGGLLEFTYTLENHRFKEYAAQMEVAYSHNREPVDGTVSEYITAGSFKEAEVTWTVRADDLVPAGLAVDQSYNVNMVITRGDVEREILINIYPSPNALKPPVAGSRG